MKKLIKSLPKYIYIVVMTFGYFYMISFFAKKFYEVGGMKASIIATLLLVSFISYRLYKIFSIEIKSFTSLALQSLKTK